MDAANIAGSVGAREEKLFHLLAMAPRCARSGEKNDEGHFFLAAMWWRNFGAVVKREPFKNFLKK